MAKSHASKVQEATSRVLMDHVVTSPASIARAQNVQTAQSSTAHVLKEESVLNVLNAPTVRHVLSVQTSRPVVHVKMVHAPISRVMMGHVLTSRAAISRVTKAPAQTRSARMGHVPTQPARMGRAAVLRIAQVVSHQVASLPVESLRAVRVESATGTAKSRRSF